MIKFFKQIFQSESNTSSRRIIAIWFAFVIIGYVVYKGVDSTNALQFVHAFLVFIEVLLVLTTSQNVISKIQNSITERKNNTQAKNLGGTNPPNEDEDINA